MRFSSCPLFFDPFHYFADRRDVKKSKPPHVEHDISVEQQQIIDAVVNGEKGVVIHGDAGTGKSTVLKRIIELLASKRTVQATAPYGIVAQNMEYNGMSLHRFCGMRDKEETVAEVLSYISSHPKRFQALAAKDLLLIIDEISTADADLLE